MNNGTDVQTLADLRAGPWHRDQAWSISRHNFSDDQLAPSTMPQRVTLPDLTARVLEQMPGITLSVQEKVALAEALAEAGVEEANLALRISDPRAKDELRAIRRRSLPLKLVALLSSIRDIDTAVELGVEVAELTVARASYGAGPIITAATLPLMVELVEHAKSVGLKVRANITMAANTTFSYVESFTKAARSAGADQIQIADSSGGLGPIAVRRLVGHVKSVDPAAAVAVHLHNDFGLAVANAIAALEAGAESFDVSVNGGGERAGQLDLAQWALILRAFYGIESGIKYGSLTRLSRVVEDISRVPIPPWQPVVGKFAFEQAVEHVMQHEDEFPMLHTPVHPNFVGGQRDGGLGRYSGQYGLMRRLSNLGLTMTAEEAAPALMALDTWFEIHKRPISDHELISLLTDARGAGIAVTGSQLRPSAKESTSAT